MISKRKIIVKDTHCLGYYRGDDNKSGVFAFLEKGGRNCVGNPMYCREEVAYEIMGIREYKRDAAYSDKYIAFYFPHSDYIGRLNKCFELIEKKLKIKNKTIFYPTNEKGLVIIKMARFWMGHCVKESLFTLFLRFGAIYYSGDFEKDLSMYTLTHKCRKAIFHFLDGNTKFDFKSWCENNLDYYDRQEYRMRDFEDNFEGFADWFSAGSYTQYLIKPGGK